MKRRTFLIEDNVADVKLIQRALQSALCLKCTIEVFSDGESALAAIIKSPPDLIILDLNLPRLDGKELLRLLKSQDSTAHIPIIVLTTSNNEDDVRYVYATGANAYVVKPLKYKDFMSAVLSLGIFWFNHTRLKS